MKYYCETKSNKSNKPGPIDPQTGWPSVHPRFVVDANSQEEATCKFEERFPGDILIVEKFPQT